MMYFFYSGILYIGCIVLYIQAIIFISILFEGLIWYIMIDWCYLYHSDITVVRLLPSLHRFSLYHFLENS